MNRATQPWAPPARVLNRPPAGSPTRLKEASLEAFREVSPLVLVSIVLGLAAGVVLGAVGAAVAGLGGSTEAAQIGLFKIILCISVVVGGVVALVTLGHGLKETWRLARAPRVGDTSQARFQALDAALETLRGRHFENPDVVAEVGTYVLAAREHLIGAAQVHSRALESDLYDIRERDGMNALVGAEFDRLMALMASTLDGLDRHRDVEHPPDAMTTTPHANVRSEGADDAMTQSEIFDELRAVWL